jgi:Holliday junction resolvase RusA-like endonuclease
MLTFFVEGKSQTAGSKTFIPAKEEGGKGRVVESGNRQAKAAWRADIKLAARQAAAVDGGEWPLADAPFAVTFTFHRVRPKGHYGSGRNAGVLKDSAPPSPITRPDALKMARAVEDALTGVLWTDDSAIVDERLRKVWGDREGVLVTVEPLFPGVPLPAEQGDGAPLGQLALGG